MFAYLSAPYPAFLAITVSQVATCPATNSTTRIKLSESNNLIGANALRSQLMKKQ